MNLQKLFEAQAVLDADIEKHHPIQEGEDRLNKKILALLVELGECANEWRGFKFWSNDQEPRVHKEEVPTYAGIPFFGDAKVTNPMLEEYVDCLHFILSIGNDRKLNGKSVIEQIEKDIQWILSEQIGFDIVELFNYLFRKTGDFTMYKSSGNYISIFAIFVVLGGKLGFSWEQIEQAYFDKNKVNHERQATGY